MRERLCFGGEKYCTDKFWSAVFRHCRFAWPHNLANAYETDPLSGLLQYSASFRARLFDLNCWTMESDFFNHFPEFRSDCAKFERPLAVYHISQQPEHDLARLRAYVNSRQRQSARMDFGRTDPKDHKMGGYLQSLALLNKSNLPLSINETEQMSMKMNII